MMQVYADNSSIKSLEKAQQGYIDALRDIENHTIGQNESRVHEEELGRVLCQADNDEQSWHCADRFVYGMDSVKQKALCVGHVVDHERKGYYDYRKKRKTARKTKDTDFKDKIFISSEQILQQAQSVADKMIPQKNDEKNEPNLSRIEILENQYYEWAAMGKEGLDCFREILTTCLVESGPITNLEQKIIRRLKKTNPFRIEMEKVFPMKKRGLAHSIQLNHSL